jgi:hypothetical protein
MSKINKDFYKVLTIPLLNGGEMRNVHRVLVRKLKEKRSLGGVSRQKKIIKKSERRNKKVYKLG